MLISYYSTYQIHDCLSNLWLCDQMRNSSDWAWNSNPKWPMTPQMLISINLIIISDGAYLSILRSFRGSNTFWHGSKKSPDATRGNFLTIQVQALPQFFWTADFFLYSQRQTIIFQKAPNNSSFLTFLFQKVMVFWRNEHRIIEVYINV